MITRILQVGGLLVSLGLLVGGQGPPIRESVGWAAEVPDLQTFTLQIDGITCGACVKEIRSALVKAPGVKAVEFQIKKKWLFFHDYSDVRAIIKGEPGTTAVSALITAVEGASSLTNTYKAKSVS